MVHASAGRTELPYAAVVKGVQCHERRGLIETALIPDSSTRYLETPLAKPNYRHAKRQKELARKTKQTEKLQRRSPRTDEPPADVGTGQPARSPGSEAVGERQ